MIADAPKRDRSVIVPLVPAPGMVTDTTNYAARGGYWNGDAVRFSGPYPEKIGGWVRLHPKTWSGTVQTMFHWADLTTVQRTLLGSTGGLYLALEGTGVFDVTPSGLTLVSGPVAGWGASGWGVGGWGAGTTLTIDNAEPSHWSFDAWGEDVLCNPRGFPIYYYDVTTPTTAAAALSSLAGAADVPAAAIQVMVEPELRYAIAFGCTPIGASARDPMFVRWADRGSVLNWTPSPTTTAGGQRLAAGSRIVIAHKLRREIVIFTDTSLYSMQATNAGTSAFAFPLVAPKTSIIGPQAAAVARDDRLFWMERNGFAVYDGRVRPLVCPVQDFVFDNLNTGRANQVIAGENPYFKEIWWFYPSLGSTVNNRYVVYNYEQDIWYFGTQVQRSAWLYSPLLAQPIAASDQGVFRHEQGWDNLDTGSPAPLVSFIQTAPFDVAEGNEVVAVQELIPDFKFGGFAGPSGTSVQVQVQASDYPGASYSDIDSQSVAGGSPFGVDVWPFTPRVDVRARGRKMTLTIVNAQLGAAWKSGAHRLRVRSDGRR